MNSKAVGLIAVVVVLVGGWYIFHQSGTDTGVNLYGNNDNTNTVTPTPVSPTETPVAPAPAPTPTTQASVKEFTVTGSNFTFVPKTLSVNKGDTVKISFVNSGGMHDFVIDEFNAKTSRINGGENASVTFVATKSGSFEYYCSVGTHRQMGMKGILTVQ